MKPKLIFIVDDDAFITKLVTKRLSEEGYYMKSFAYAEDCIAALNENPDLIVLDYYFLKEGVSKMDGLEALNKIKAIKTEVPVIMLSGQEKGEVVLELARSGIADYVIKDNNLMDSLFVSIQEVFNHQ